jgi:hypothetical protein
MSITERTIHSSLFVGMSWIYKKEKENGRKKKEGKKALKSESFPSCGGGV